MKKSMGWGLAVYLMGSAAFGQSLPLSSYLQQVKGQGADYQAAQASVEGLDKQSHQQDLTYSPVLVASYNHLDDTEPTVNPFVQPRTQTDSAGVSLTDVLPFGPTLSLGYSFQNTNYQINPLFASAASTFPDPYYQISPVISLSMPLFKNFLGEQTAAGVHKVQYQLEAAKNNAAFGREQLLYNAKVAYWDLALAQSATRIRKDSLERNKKIWEWTKKRVSRNLAEKPDALQAEASVRVAELDLQMAIEKEKTARLEFNRFRDKKGSEVPEELEPVEQSLNNLKVEMPAALNNRFDLQAAQNTVEQQKAAYDEAHANVYPDITVNASYRGNGTDATLNNANQTAFQFTYPTWTVGAQFNLPLDVFTSSRVAEGYQRNYDSAVLSLKGKQLEVSQEWSQLKTQLQDVNRRLDMTSEIEEIQKTKADEEKKRLEYGRTTEFQLLSFENDYNTARLNHLSVVFEKLSILAQAQWWLATDLYPQGAK